MLLIYDCSHMIACIWSYAHIHMIDHIWLLHMIAHIWVITYDWSHMIIFVGIWLLTYDHMYMIIYVTHIWLQFFAHIWVHAYDHMRACQMFVGIWCWYMSAHIWLHTYDHMRALICDVGIWAHIWTYHSVIYGFPLRCRINPNSHELPAKFCLKFCACQAQLTNVCVASWTLRPCLKSLC